MTLIKFIILPALLASTFIACNNSTREAETTTVADSTKTAETKNPADTSQKQMQLTAMFVDFNLGDISHFTFKDESGKEWDFADNEDSTYKFSVELPKNKSNEENQGWGSDKALQGKWFFITYKSHTEPEYENGPMVQRLVIMQVKPK